MGSIPTLPGERRKPGKSKSEEKLGEWGKTKKVDQEREASGFDTDSRDLNREGKGRRETRRTHSKERGNESESETRKKRKERWQIQKKREAPIVLETKVCTHGHHDGDSQRTIKILGLCI